MDTLPKSQTRQHASAVDKPKRPKRPRRRSGFARTVIGLLRIVGLSYAALLLTLIFMESRLVYPGAYFADAAGPPPTIGSPIETVSYRSTDNITLQGRLLDRQSSQRLVLYFHGNGTKAKWLDGWLQELSQSLDATVMAAEYRGYEDDVTPDEKGVLQDCFAARDYLSQRYQKQPTDIVLFGTSLGGGCAVALAAQGGAKALVLDRTFDRLVDLAAGKYPIVPVRWVMRNRYDSVAKLTAYKGPLIQVHGSSDTLIPIRYGQALFRSAGCKPKEFINVKGLGHNDPLPTATLQQIAATLDGWGRASEPSESVDRLPAG